MTEQIWNLDSEMETIKKEAIENLKLKKILAGMKFLLGGLNSRFEMTKESLIPAWDVPVRGMLARLMAFLLHFLTSPISDL